MIDYLTKLAKKKNNWLIKTYHRTLFYEGSKTMYKGFILFKKIGVIDSNVSDSLYIDKIIKRDNSLGLTTFII